MPSRTQTLVQLTADLVELLDRRAASRGISRSQLIRELLTEALAVDRAALASEQLVAGYRRVPQSEGRDAWGDLDAWTEANTRRNMAALTDEEEESW